MMIRSLAIAAALCLCCATASAAPLTMEQCRAKYKADQAKGITTSWVNYKEKYCGMSPDQPRKKSK